MTETLLAVTCCEHMLPTIGRDRVWWTANEDDGELLTDRPFGQAVQCPERGCNVMLEVREVPPQPADETLAEAVLVVKRQVVRERLQAGAFRKGGYRVLASASDDSARWLRDLAARLRAFGAEPTAADYEMAFGEWHLEELGWPPGARQHATEWIRDRAAERAREREGTDAD